MGLYFDAVITQEGEGFRSLFEAPSVTTFRAVYPNGAIQEWEGSITAGAVKDDGTMDAECSVLSIVREGSIYDREGSD